MEAFEDKIEGWKRAQHRYIGAGGSGKHDEQDVIPPRPYLIGNVRGWAGNAPHTHEVEERLVLEGQLDVFIEDERGNRITKRLGKWIVSQAPV